METPIFSSSHYTANQMLLTTTTTTTSVSFNNFKVSVPSGLEWISLSLFSCMFFLIVVPNLSLILALLISKSRKNYLEKYTISLAMADLLVGVIVLPQEFSMAFPHSQLPIVFICNEALVIVGKIVKTAAIINVAGVIKANCTASRKSAKKLRKASTIAPITLMWLLAIVLSIPAAFNFTTIPGSKCPSESIDYLFITTEILMAIVGVISCQSCCTMHRNMKKAKQREMTRQAMQRKRSTRAASFSLFDGNSGENHMFQMTRYQRNYDVQSGVYLGDVVVSCASLGRPSIFSCSGRSSRSSRGDLASHGSGSDQPSVENYQLKPSSHHYNDIETASSNSSIIRQRIDELANDIQRSVTMTERVALCRRKSASNVSLMYDAKCVRKSAILYIFFFFICRFPFLIALCQHWIFTKLYYSVDDNIANSIAIIITTWLAIFNSIINPFIQIWKSENLDKFLTGLISFLRKSTTKPKPQTEIPLADTN